MVLQRHPSKYKHLLRTMISQLIQHEHITTTRGKAKHLKPYAQHVLNMARLAKEGKRSPLNLLRGRIHTRKIQTKLLVDLMARLKGVQGGYVLIKQLNARRRGDNAPMVQIYIKGNQKTQFEKKRKQQALKKGEIPNIQQYHAKLLLQERQYLQKKMDEQNVPEKKAFFKEKLDRLQFRQSLLNKSLKQPPKYALLI